MNLGKLDNMFTETPFRENDDENRAASSPADLDFDIGKLSVSPVQYESTSVRTDESSGTMAASDLSATGGLLSAFDSIGFAEKLLLSNRIAKGAPKSDDIGSVCEATLHGQRPIEEQGFSTHDSSDCSRIHGPSSHEDAEAEDVDEIERTQKSNDHLIVYTSSRRNTSRNTYAKLNPNNDSKEQSTNCRVIDQNDSLSDLESLQIARRKRSLLSKRVKSSVWGLVSLPASKQNTELDPCLGNVKKVGSVKGGKPKKNAIKDLAGQKTVQKSSIPTGRISLKIRIGNQSCGVVNVAEKLVSGKNISGSSDTKDKKYREELPRDILLLNENNLENLTASDASVLGTRLDVTGCVKNKSLGGSTENGCLDPGTSPDSEVINSIPDPPLCERGIEDMQDSPEMPIGKGFQESFADSIAGVSNSSLKMKSRKGKKTTGAEPMHSVRAPLESGLTQKVVNISKCDNVFTVPTENHFHNAQSRDGVSSSPAGCSGTNDSTPCSTSKKACGDSEVHPSPLFSDATEPSISHVHKSLCNGKKNLKCSRAKGGCRSSGILDFPPKKGKSSKKKGDNTNLVAKHQISLKDDASGVLSRVESRLEAGNQTLPHPGEVGYISTHSAGSEFISSSGRLNCQHAPPRNAWVLCDECQKWRRIAAILADQIDQTNCRWTCKDNADINFADCSIPQEKSNSEINEELDISDASGDEKAGGKLPKSNINKSTAVNKQSSWTLIKSNLFLHRRRKTQNIDEVMVCHCKPPSDGRMGCGAKCLNRLLNIECVKGTCPCGELCSNQQFQKRIYAKLKWLRCGKKGFGLQALQNISEGQFLIEYVGEVLDIHAHEARQREYALQGHKHFYFMTLNGSEVIDACAKGNLGRFINHSCDPNCVTEKWMVNGEVCVGLFAIRDIKKGEEVTFDYNFVRVLGAAAKKCVCGSPNCRGYIGGDPTNSEVIVQEDSDDEYAEPVMICDDRAMNNDWTDIMSQTLLEKENKNKDGLEEERHRMKIVNGSGQSESITSETSLDKLGVKPSSNGCSEAATATQVVDMTVQDKYEPDNSDSSVSATLNTESNTNSPVSLMKASLQSEEMMNNAMPLDLHLDNELKMSTARIPGKLQPDAVKSKKKLKYGTMRGKDESAKSDSLVKTHQSSPLIRKGKVKSNAVKDKGALDGDKSNAVRHKSKKLPGLPHNSHLEAVEGKLNELLDTEGGISKRKDASRGYLKLLFLTAASETNGHGEAIQSNRDLSMILDALLKTKSRTVLVDIINKNGLQMLHNIMKRYRKEFNKIPILRKLLKVLEYLAMREILTLEHITGGPPRPGAESFKDSILTLTEHRDKQVHQIARNFRDKWIPKSLRKPCFTVVDDANKVFSQHSTYGKLSVSTDHWSDRSGKHSDSVESCNKQPSVASGVETSTPDPSSASGCSTATNGTRTRKRKSRWDVPMEECKHPKIATTISDDREDNDAPPGFSSPCNNSMVPSTALNQPQRDKRPSNIVLADPLERFISHLPLSYGVPYSIAQQFGAREGEAAPIFTIAPGLPFHPFPPLPPCNKEEQPSSTGQDNVPCAASYSGNKRRVPCSPDTPEMNIKANEHPGLQPEEGSNNLARKYFRQQKWSHSKIPPLPPPWLRMRNGWGQSRNGVVDFGNGANQFANAYTPEDVNWRG